ncbi:uncharacterized protein F5147DRAFT_768849 [Suillus discolor]|uniref:Uncharacterized protein n=1 Tax=Suillus discolor TaxID=1912936 RepID=A0A9P7JY55_9AGAM|nr:uncharacterized protein F5147DRAFT_768849 [Suillus discolor]KAG2116479.1 hypothetical protein F5147DRAFT_768849 [Suillus discolor]
MAPSLEISSKGHLPLPQTSPVKALASTIQQYLKEHNENSSGPATGSLHSPGWMMDAAEQAIEGLSPAFVSTPITPTHKQKHNLLETEPESAKEQLYWDALCSTYDCKTHYKSALVGMQSTIILQSMFCDWLSSQLAAQDKKKKKTKKGGQLVGDELPRLLMSDEFHHHVVEHQRVAEEEEAACRAC